MLDSQHRNNCNCVGAATACIQNSYRAEKNTVQNIRHLNTITSSHFLIVILITRIYRNCNTRRPGQRHLLYSLSTTVSYAGIH
jgi:hypothetical protein